MDQTKQQKSRRSFIKASALAGGGLLLNFNWLIKQGASIGSNESIANGSWLTMNGYIKINSEGKVTIMSPNPEGGQNVKTTMPMIVAEELDVKWEDVLVEQAPLDTTLYSRQFIGGSQAIRYSWKSLRTAGATARQMLIQAAADLWKVPTEEISTNDGTLFHNKSGKKAGYGELATAASAVKVPEKIHLKSKDKFKIIGSSKKNVDGLKIVSGQPLFGIDTTVEGSLIAMIVHPPAFGMQLKSFDATSVKSMPGIRDVFEIKVLNDDYGRQHFDTCTFLKVVAIVGDSTWQVMQAKKAIKVSWEPFETYTEDRTPYGGQKQVLTIPAGLESSSGHAAQMAEKSSKPAQVVRRDGDPETAFKNAAKVLERTYTVPFLAHNCMEPMNFWADVKDDSAHLIGPLQKAELTEQALAARLGLPLDKINIEMTRLGGGFGRRSYAHWAIESALISQKMKAPIKLIYTREDDMTSGIYRPAYQASYKAALDANNELIALHINAGGIPESPLFANRFPAGAVDHYLAESWTINTNITIGSFRAPRSNFMAYAEQAFLDELAEVMGKDPIEFRITLLEKALKSPVGSNNEYDAQRYIQLLKVLKEKSDWGNQKPGVSRGVSAYFCHNSYAAQVMDVHMVDGSPVVERVCCVLDCGTVINPDAAINLSEGGIVDGIGVAMYGQINFVNGEPDRKNYNAYRMIRMSEAPKKIDVHFVNNDEDPSGLGEPAFPPVFGALANALYRATGKRFYQQPFDV